MSVTLIGINRGYDKRYNASAVTHELSEKTKSAIHNRRVKKLDASAGRQAINYKNKMARAIERLFPSPRNVRYLRQTLSSFSLLLM